MAKRKPKKVKKDTAVKWYVGIIDTMGLDSFDEVGHSNSCACMQIRAAANPQRHAKMFLASFPATMKVPHLVREMKDAWEMWSFINCFAKEIRCDKKDMKTVQNIKQLSDKMIELTGNAYGF